MAAVSAPADAPAAADDATWPTLPPAADAAAAAAAEAPSYPLAVEYCPMCGLPPEYCRFNSNSVFAKCKPWLKEAHPALVPELFEEGELEAKLAAMAVDAEAAAASATAAADAAVASSLAGPKLVKRAGGRSTRVNPEVVIHTDQRKGRKQVTIVMGLDLFDIKLADAARACKKAFASGATVAKSADNRDTVEIQGTRAHEFADLVRTKYKVPPELIFIVGPTNASSVPAVPARSRGSDGPAGPPPPPPVPAGEAAETPRPASAAARLSRVTIM